MLELARHWEPRRSAPPSQADICPSLHPLTVQVLYNRGLADRDDITAFLERRWPEPNPFDLEGVPAAIERLRYAIHAQELIAVYGDFDVDGITATVLLVQTLNALGALVVPYIPDRVDEGYGLNEPALKELHEKGVQLIVTADCGVRSVQEIDYANRLGLDVIITDHHLAGAEPPAAVAAVNGRGPDSQGALAGVGVAYRLAQGLLRAAFQDPSAGQPVRLTEQDLLDLVALGTVADLVPLLGENRALVHHGLAQLNRMERPGIEALCHQARLPHGRIDSTAISYALAPRLNAPGRMGQTRLAFDLLMTQYPAEADQLASKLDQLNRERQQLTREVQERAQQLVLANGDDAPLIFAADEGFPIGVVGLVAGRLTEDFHRPAVAAQIGQELTRGSARSIDAFHITQALDRCADLLVRYGGHAAAAGFTVANENLAPLAERLRSLAHDQLTDKELTPVLQFDAEAPLADLSWELQGELAGLEPLGYDNPPPTFVSRGVRVLERRQVGNDRQHLKLSLFDGKIAWDAI
ncbi:MAG: single-stranded-DNA-specific exonuclease RecJ, partial [Anaerolineales bacterium]|nr:single-stranded-DNA-specific exonuclease RecJ [Anaerolineales bacterium]